MSRLDIIILRWIAKEFCFADLTERDVRGRERSIRRLSKQIEKEMLKVEQVRLAGIKHFCTEDYYKSRRRKNDKN